VNVCPTLLLFGPLSPRLVFLKSVSAWALSSQRLECLPSPAVHLVIKREGAASRSYVIPRSLLMELSGTPRGVGVHVHRRLSCPSSPGSTALQRHVSPSELTPFPVWFQQDVGLLGLQQGQTPLPGLCLPVSATSFREEVSLPGVQHHTGCWEPIISLFAFVLVTGRLFGRSLMNLIQHHRSLWWPPDGAARTRH
jgi:hypothetical protein